MVLHALCWQPAWGLSILKKGVGWWGCHLLLLPWFSCDERRGRDLLTASLALATSPPALCFSPPHCRLACDLLFTFFSLGSTFRFWIDAAVSFSVPPWNFSSFFSSLTAFLSRMPLCQPSAVVSFGLCSLLPALEEPGKSERGWQKDHRTLLPPQSTARSVTGRPAKPAALLHAAS